MWRLQYTCYISCKLYRHLYVIRQAWEHHLQLGTLRELAAPRLMKKAVLKQMEEAKAAGVDADFSQQTASRRSKSLAQLAENDDMVDL